METDTKYHLNPNKKKLALRCNEQVEKEKTFLAVRGTNYSKYLMILVDVHCRSKARSQATCLWSNKVVDFANSADLQ